MEKKAERKGEIITKEDGTISVDGETFASMEDYIGSIREHEDEIKGKKKEEKKS